MKKIYISLLFTYSSFVAFGQIVNIPDANFKAKLLAANPSNGIASDINDTYIQIDINNNNEIEVSEALVVFALSVGNSAISDFTGIESFTNLRVLGCQQNNLTELPISNLSHLYNLYCYSNPLSSLASIENLTSLTRLEFGGIENTFTTVNLQNLSNLSWLNFSSTLLTSIDVCGTAVTWLWCPNNPNLQFISIKNNILSPNNRLTNNSSFPPPLPYLYFENLPSLTTICYDEGELAAVQQSSYFPSEPLLITDCNANCTSLNIQNQNENVSIILAPNPVNAIVSIVANSTTKIESISLYNPLRQLVKTMTANELNSSFSIDVSALKIGTYFMEISSNNVKTTKKLVNL